MKYRSMAKNMTEDEIKQLLNIVFRDATLIAFERHLDAEFISIQFALPRYPSYLKLDFLPDDVYLIGKDDKLDGEPMTGDVLFQYQQFMIAKGYSEFWLNNPYI